MSIRVPAAALAFLLVLPVCALAQEKMMEVDGRALMFNDIQPTGFAPGMKLAAVAGDPSKEGQPYVVRLRLPDGYAFPAHWHPQVENVTVLTGTLYLAMGSDAKMGNLKRYVSGDYLYIPAKMSHYGQARGETTLQLHGMGPFAINLTQTAATSTK